MVGYFERHREITEPLPMSQSTLNNPLRNQSVRALPTNVRFEHFLIVMQQISDDIAVSLCHVRDVFADLFLFLSDLTFESESFVPSLKERCES